MKNYLLAIFNAIIWLAVGTSLMLIDNNYWTTLGIAIFIIGIVLIGAATVFAYWDKFIEKTTAMQYLFDSARHLDSQRLDALLYAMGLKPLKVQEYKTDITINTANTNGTVEQTRNIFNLPISIEQLRQLADGLINEQAPFSRREWVDRRHVLTDAQYRNLQQVFETEKIVELKIAANPNAGFKLSDYGISVMREYAPSPTPRMEEAQNPA